MVPYVMPGFALAKQAAEIFDAAPAVEGLILHKHGIFTFGATAREAYERMIEMVTRAEERLARNRKRGVRDRAAAAGGGAARARSRRSCAAPAARRTSAAKAPGGGSILDFRATPAILNFVNGAEVGALQPGRRRHARPHHPHQELAADRCARPRTASWPPSSAPRTQAVAAFVGALQGLFHAQQCARRRRSSAMLDPLPRVALVPGLGLFGLGRSKKDAAIAADIAEAAIETITDAEAIGRFESISEADMFDMEYWSLEQAKLGSGRGEAARRPGRRRSPARPARSAPRPPRRSRRRAPRSRCSISTRRRRGPRPSRSAARRWRCAAT